MEIMRNRLTMSQIEATQQLEMLEPVPPPPPSPTYEHIVGNQIRWTTQGPQTGSGTPIFAIVAGFAVLLFGLGQEGTARLAAGWLGAVLGFWLR